MTSNSIIQDRHVTCISCETAAPVILYHQSQSNKPSRSFIYPNMHISGDYEILKGEVLCRMKSEHTQYDGQMAPKAFSCLNHLLEQNHMSKHEDLFDQIDIVGISDRFVAWNASVPHLSDSPTAVISGKTIFLHTGWSIILKGNPVYVRMPVVDNYCTLRYVIETTGKVDKVCQHKLLGYATKSTLPGVLGELTMNPDFNENIPKPVANPIFSWIAERMTLDKSLEKKEIDMGSTPEMKSTKAKEELHLQTTQFYDTWKDERNQMELSKLLLESINLELSKLCANKDKAENFLDLSGVVNEWFQSNKLLFSQVKQFVDLTT
jgi:hypothetical protein